MPLESTNGRVELLMTKYGKRKTWHKSIGISQLWCCITLLEEMIRLDTRGSDWNEKYSIMVMSFNSCLEHGP